MKKILLLLAFMSLPVLSRAGSDSYTSPPDMNDPTIQISFEIFDSTTAVPIVGQKHNNIRIPFNMTLVRWEIVGNASGSAAVGILRASAFSGFPTFASINAGSTPSVTTAQKSSGTCSGFSTVDLNQGDYLKPNLISITTMRRITVNLIGQRR